MSFHTQSAPQAGAFLVHYPSMIEQTGLPSKKRQQQVKKKTPRFISHGTDLENYFYIKNLLAQEGFDRNGNPLPYEGVESVRRIDSKQLFQDLVFEMNQLETTDEIESFLEANKSIFDLFHASPSPINGLSGRDMLEAGVRVSKIPELQARIGMSAVGEIVYHFNFDEDPKVLHEWLTTGSVAESIDRILYTAALGKNARAQGGWALRFVYQLKNEIDALAEKERHPLRKIAVDFAKRRMDQEMESPTGSVIQHEGDRGSGREIIPATERLRNETEMFTARVTAEAGHYAERRVGKIARDTIATFDQSGLAQSFARVDLNKITDREPVSREIVDAKAWQEALASVDTLSMHDGKRVFEITMGFVGNDPKQFIEYHPFLDEEFTREYQAAARRLIEVRRLFGERRARVQHEQEVRNQAESERVRNDMIHLVQTDARFSHLKAEYLPKLMHPDSELWFSAMERLRLLDPAFDQKFEELQQFFSKNSLETRERLMKEEEDEGASSEIQRDLRIEHEMSGYLQSKDFLENSRDIIDYLAKDDSRERVPYARFGPFASQLETSGSLRDRTGFEMLREFMRPNLREEVEKMMGVDLTELSLREQIEVFKYLNSSTPEEAEAVFAHAREYGIPYLQTFLVAETQPEAVKTIQEIAGGDKEKARQIFERFGEIVKDAQDNVTNILREKLQNPDSATIEMERELRNELLSRAGMFFESAAKASKSGSSSSIDAVLSRYEKETVLFASFFKTLHAEIGNDALYNVRGLSLGIERGARVTRDEREEMEKIMRLNWIKEGKEVVDQVVSEFNASLTGERGDRSFLHILKKDQKVMAFIRFEERPDLGPGAVYAGSLNVRTDVRGSALGEVLMHEAVLGEAKDHVIHAYVDAKAEVGVAYVEKLGAVLEGVDVETRGETTMHWLKLRLDFVMNKKLKTKNGRIREWIQRGVEHESLDVAKEGDRLVALMTRLKEEGKVITRVLLDKAEPSRRTFILEALPAPKETQTAV